MGSKALAAIGAIALMIAACGSSGTSTPSPTPGGLVPGTSPSSASDQPTAPPDAPPSQDTSAAPTDPAPSGGATRLVILHGAFTGHSSDPLASADQTVELELHWNAGPDDVHDSKAFRLVSGSFTFSEAIDGVCGGSRSEAGALTPWSDTFLISGDIQDRDQASVTLVDARLSSAAVELSLTSSFAVSAPDPEGCAELSRTGVGVCTLAFPQVAIGRLQEDATCSEPTLDLEWTGRLAP
jgi:hypothetical protein